jgi:hypothetical protein
MEKAFRTILAEFMAADAPAEPDMTGGANNGADEAARARAVDGEWSMVKPFVFSFSGAGRVPPKPARAAYAPRVRPVTVPTPAVRPSAPPEPVIALTSLSTADRSQVDELLGLGAEELRDGLSPARLKRAYRRLARRLHPDMLPSHTAVPEREASRRKFIRLRAAYERLTKALSQYKESVEMTARR